MKILLIFLILIANLYSAPAYNKTREFKQADGTTFEAKAFGNQHLNWIQTSDGEILKYNSKNKNFEYATIKENRLTESGVRYERGNSIRARSIGKVNKIDKEQLYKLWSKKQKESNERKKAR